jgi:integrase
MGYHTYSGGETMAQKRREMKRTRNGVGNVREIRPGYFQGSIQLKPGDRRYVTGRSPDEVEAKLAELKVLRQRNQLPGKGKRTVGAYLDDWLRDHITGKKAPRTVDNYELNINRLKPYIGSIPLETLNPDDITRAYNAMAQAGLGPSSIHQAHRVLRAAMRQAVKARVLYWDPTQAVTPPRLPKNDPRIFTAEEIRTLLRTTHSDGRWHILWVVLVSTGMRLGEALGLQWGDIDLERGAVHILRDVERVKGKGLALGELKTAASKRSVPLQKEATEVLRRYRATEEERHQFAGQEWSDSAQVFSTADFGLVDPGTADKAFKRALAAAGLADAHPHDLRHTVSSHLQARGRNSREAQEVLGHESEVTTRRFYTNVVPDRRSAIMAPLAEYFATADDDVDSKVTGVTEVTGRPGSHD